MRKSLRKKGQLLLCCLLLIGCLSACGDSERGKVVFTTALAKDELFRIDKVSCTLPEYMLYLTNVQNRYEDAFGAQIWQVDYQGMTLGNNVKDNVLARIARMKSVYLLALEKEVTLTEREETLLAQAAKTYVSSLSETEVEVLGVTEELVLQLYKENALADKVYQQIIAQVNPEISDDEARTITVEHILIKTYNLDENGNKQVYSTYSKQLAMEKAQEVLKRAKAGEDFHVLAGEYSEDKTLTYSFGKGEMEAGFEEAAFNLGNNEISDIVETQHGYHIIKCISTFNREVTDENKKKIVEQRREEVFGEEYDTFVSSLTKNLNKELWKTVSFIHDEEVVTSDFFEVYNSYFEDYQTP